MHPIRAELLLTAEFAGWPPVRFVSPFVGREIGVAGTPEAWRTFARRARREDRLAAFGALEEWERLGQEAAPA